MTAGLTASAFRQTKKPYMWWRAAPNRVILVWDIMFNPQGKAINMIHLPERCTNVCFGGEQRNDCQYLDLRPVCQHAGRAQVL